MEKRIVTPITSKINDAVDSFKYNRGRYLCIVIAILFLGGGVGILFLGSFYIAIGVILALVGFFFLWAFTLGWKSVLTSISARNRAANPVKEGSSLVYVFREDQVDIALEVPGKGKQEESHPYSYFSAVDVTSDYLFLVYGDPKKDPALPVVFDEDLLGFLKTKITHVKDYRHA